MTVPTVKIASAAIASAVIDVIMLAFCADPAARWAWRDPHQFLRHFPRFAKAFGGEAFTHNSAYCVDGYAGAALWLAPGVGSDDETMSLMQETWSEKSRRDAPQMFEQMSRYHPSEPHWYLPLMGVDPLQQGRGYGSLLMKHAVEVIDRDHQAAYLESSNPKNVPLYQRHGFELLGTIQVGSSPPIFPMLRKARNGTNKES